jgi:hypothetical protein
MNLPRLTWSVCTALAACALSLACGCGPAGIVTHPVSGSVTFDGQPVAEGEIIFRVPDSAQGSYAAKIHDGRYELESTAGAKRVEITAYRTVETAAAPSGEGAQNRQMYLPAKYNEQSQLRAEVTAAGPNTFDFALTP